VFDRAAAGRFAMYRDRLNASDPLGALESDTHGPISTGPGPSDHRRRSLVEVSGSGPSTAGAVVVDHSVGERLKRQSAHVANFGRPKDCPKRSRIRWDITSSETTALSQAVAAEAGADLGFGGPSVPTHRLKCRVVLQGPDVFSGMRAFTEAGILRPSPPECVRDAPSAVGATGTIHVVDGRLVDEW
jgi:hypothetical protein